MRVISVSFKVTPQFAVENDVDWRNRLFCFAMELGGCVIFQYGCPMVALRGTPS